MTTHALFRPVLYSRILSSVALALSLLISQNSYAGTMESARRLIDLLDVPAALEETIIASVDQARSDLLKRGRPAATVNMVSANLKAEMLASMSSLIDEVSAIYADEFTEEELNDLIAFYETPTGQKYVKAQRSLRTKQDSALAAWLQDVRKRTIEKITTAAS